MSYSNVLWNVQCIFHKSGGTQDLSQAELGEIERVFKLLWTEIVPKDKNLHNYECTIKRKDVEAIAVWETCA